MRGVKAVATMIAVVIVVLFGGAPLTAQSVWVCTSPKAYAYHSSDRCYLLNRCTYEIKVMSEREARQMRRSLCARCPMRDETTESVTDNNSIGGTTGDSQVSDCGELRRQVDSLQTLISRLPRYDSLIASVDAAHTLLQAQYGVVEALRLQLIELSNRSRRQDSLLLVLNARVERPRVSQAVEVKSDHVNVIGLGVDLGVSVSTRFEEGSLRQISLDYGANLLARFRSHSVGATQTARSEAGIGVVIEASTLYGARSGMNLGWVLRIGGIVELQERFSLSMTAPVNSAFVSTPILDGIVTKLTWRMTNRPYVSSLHAGIVHERYTNMILPTLGVSFVFSALY